jgi:hypothetical protein
MSSNGEQHNPARRAFLRDILRVAAVGALAAGAGALMTRRGRCDVAPACQSCASLAGCAKPEAVSARQTTQGTEHGRR